MDFIEAKPDHRHVTYHIYMCNVQHVYGINCLAVKRLVTIKKLKKYDLAVPFSKSMLFHSSGSIIKIHPCTDSRCAVCNRSVRCNTCFNCVNAVFTCKQSICPNMELGPAFHQSQLKDHLLDWKAKPIPLTADLGLVDEPKHESLVPLHVVRFKSPRLGVRSLQSVTPGPSGLQAEVSHSRH